MITGAYKPKLIKAELSSGEKVDCLAFTVDRKNSNYIAKLSVEEIAYYIDNASGFLGSCKEYLNYTIASLNELKIKDKKMEMIYNIINKNYL